MRSETQAAIGRLTKRLGTTGGIVVPFVQGASGGGGYYLREHSGEHGGVHDVRFCRTAREVEAFLEGACYAAERIRAE